MKFILIHSVFKSYFGLYVTLVSLTWELVRHQLKKEESGGGVRSEGGGVRAGREKKMKQEERRRKIWRRKKRKGGVTYSTVLLPASHLLALRESGTMTVVL